MTILRTRDELREWRSDGPLGLVPTMGALHEGHLDLVRAARQREGRVLVTIFVNPTQFAPHEDLSRYPRPFQEDVRKANEAGADAIFHPPAEEIYPPSDATRVRVGGVAEPLEGERRPGHFEGVATVVARLTNLARPTLSVYGLKDLQQCAVIARMHRDLALPGTLAFHPTRRESNGLAMSSRNAYLSPADRPEAGFLSEALRGPDLAWGRDELQRRGWEVDYLERVSLADFRPTEVDEDAAIVAAARYGGVRLIDSRLLGTPTSLGGINSLFTAPG